MNFPRPLLSSLLLLPLFGCGSNKAAPPDDSGAPLADAGTLPGDSGAPRTDPGAVHVVGGSFRDGQGRQLLFRGYNVKVAPLFDVTFPDGRTANETLFDFSETDAARYEEFGFNAMRLAVNWSGLEPTPSAYSADFFAKLDAMLALAAAHHYYVLIDMHQDAYSKEIGEDGAPLFAITPTPVTLLSGPYDDSRRQSPAVVNAGFNFFDNVAGSDGRPVQDALAAAFAQVVTHVLKNPVVLGYETLNEPVVLVDPPLRAFHEKVADAIHAIDRDAPVLFEPIALRNQSDSATLPKSAWSHGAGAYSPHIYTDWFSYNAKDWVSQDPSILLPSMTAANAEAAAWGVPLFVTEFGCDQTVPQGPGWLAAELDLQEKFLASSTSWVWRETGSWGLNDPTSEHAKTAAVMARTFPRAVAGDIVSVAHPSPGDLVVTFKTTAKTLGLPHEVSMSSIYASGYAVTCDGAAVSPTLATGRGSFLCPPAGAKAGETHSFEVVGVPQ